jgi:hypothetical protein
MSKRGLPAFTATLLIAAACASGQPEPGAASKSEPGTLAAPAPASRLPVVPMDSATIYRLCAKPDSVRAGKAECVLKDQSPTPQMVQPRPMPPARRPPPPPP